MSFRNQKSWLLSRYAYPLTSNNIELTNNLINYYKNTNEDFEKLLIMNTVAENFNDTVFIFMRKELINSSDKKIRLLIIKSLGKTQNLETVIKWIKVNYTAFDRDKNETFEYYHQQIESKIGSQLVTTLIEHDFDPATVLTDDKEPKLYRQLYDKLSSFQRKKELNSDDTEKLNNLKSVETAILNNQSLNTAWENYKEKHKRPEFPAEMLSKHKAELSELAFKTKKLFENYKIDNKYKEDYLKRLENLDGDFFEKK
jgi:hypothetical protein